MLWLVHSGTQRPVKARDMSGQHVPLLRVGDFIRTFPFNTATLKASRHKLDVKSIIRELHRLTGRLASGQSEEEELKEDEDDFDSLLWGPKDPPLISQCFKTS